MSRKILLILILIMLGATTLVYASSDAPFGYQVVRQEAILVDPEGEQAGTAEFWNTRDNFIVELQVDGDWRIKDTQVYAGEEPPPFKKNKDKPDFGKFPCKRDFAATQNSMMVQCSLKDELGHSWGGDQTRYIAAHADLGQYDNLGLLIAEKDVWVYFEDTAVEFDDLAWGGYFITKFAHPRRGHFIDSPVSGLTYETPTNWGTTDASGAFDDFPGETVNLWLGTVYLGESATANKISPLDVFKADVNDPQVVNMARLIQSLDADANPKGGIEIRPVVIGCLDMAMEELGLLGSGIDWTLDGQVETVILETIAQCEGNPENIVLEIVSAEEAQGNLEAGLNASGIFRKNVSKTEDWGETKQKLEVMPVY
ncbi:MAG: hypothetical protein JSW55_11475, partial [Chloroflexota bacterium]